MLHCKSKGTYGPTWESLCVQIILDSKDSTLQKKQIIKTSYWLGKNFNHKNNLQLLTFQKKKKNIHLFMLKHLSYVTRKQLFTAPGYDLLTLGRT